MTDIKGQCIGDVPPYPYCQLLQLVELSVKATNDTDKLRWMAELEALIKRHGTTVCPYTPWLDWHKLERIEPPGGRCGGEL